MEFFENALSKAKEAIDIAAEKTSEVVNVSKQKYDIAAAENKLNKDYEALGKLYYSFAKNGITDNDELKAKVAEINEKTAKIKDLRDGLNAIKNNKICPKCGLCVEKDAQFCKFCGAGLNADEDTESEANDNAEN